MAVFCETKQQLPLHLHWRERLPPRVPLGVDELHETIHARPGASRLDTTNAALPLSRTASASSSPRTGGWRFQLVAFGAGCVWRRHWRLAWDVFLLRLLFFSPHRFYHGVTRGPHAAPSSPACYDLLCCCLPHSRAHGFSVLHFLALPCGPLRFLAAWWRGSFRHTATTVPPPYRRRCGAACVPCHYLPCAPFSSQYAIPPAGW